MSVEDQREADEIAGVPWPETQALAGHEGVWTALDGALAQNRLPAAFLLHGPRGIGKATLAFAFARAVLAATGDEPHERVAAQVAAMSHPNLFVLRRPRDLSSSSPKFFTAIRVEDVRQTRESLQHTRGRAGFRVCIIDSIDDCNTSSANALLKTLEEPPRDTLFLVISHRPGGLLPTIRSRCQARGMRPLHANTVRAILGESGMSSDPDALDRATRLAKGRPRRGFETLILTEGALLESLLEWLKAPHAHAVRAHLVMADSLAASKGAELAFAQDIVRDWIASEAEAQARRGGGPRRLQLASANQLWDKASALFADADIYNLDRRQTLVSVFDAIREHCLSAQSVVYEPR